MSAPLRVFRNHLGWVALCLRCKVWHAGFDQWRWAMRWAHLHLRDCHVVDPLYDPIRAKHGPPVVDTAPYSGFKAGLEEM